MEGIITVKQTVESGDWLAKIDLKDAYLTVAIFPGHRHFLQFFWEGIRYEFISLPFGVSQAPWAFTKLLRPVMVALRRRDTRRFLFGRYPDCGG